MKITELITLDDYNYHFRFNTRIFELGSKGFDNEQINQAFLEMKNNLKSEEVFDFVRSGFQLLGSGELDWNDDKLRDFIIQRRKDFNIEDLWKMILEENSYYFDLLDDQSKRITMEYISSNVQTALIILIAILGQEEVEKNIISSLSVLEINNYALHRLSWTYQQFIEHHYLHGNLDFLVQLFEVLFKNFPKLIIRTDDAKDFLLATFIYLYKKIPVEYSDYEFNNLLIKNGVEKISDDVWVKELNLKQFDVSNFIKSRATFSKVGKGSIWDLKLTDEDKIKFKNILAIIGYKTKNPDRIEQFLNQNKLTKIGEIRYLLTYSEDRSDEDEMTDKDVVDYIKNNIANFSFDDVFDRVIRSNESDRMLIWLLYILVLKKNQTLVVNYIVDAHKDAKISMDLFLQISSAYLNLKRFGVDVKKIDLSPDHQIVQSNLLLPDALIKERIYGQLLDFVIFIIPNFVFAWLGMLIFGTEEGGKFFIGIYILVFVVMQIRLTLDRSQTMGQYFFNIQVFDIKANKRVGFWRYVFIRDFVGKTLIIGAIPLVNLFFMPFYFVIDHLFVFKKDRRAIHDLIAGTRVIKLPLEQQRKKLIDFTRI